MKAHAPFIVILAMVLFCGGCVLRKPFRAVPESSRLGLTIREGIHSYSSAYTTANAQAMRDAAPGSGLVPGAILHAAAARSDSKGVSWVTSIRADSGINEADMVLQKISERVKAMQDVAVNGNPGPVLTIQLQLAGISEVQRGGWWAAFGTASATLMDVHHDLLWSATASSTSTKPRRREDYERQPTLYREDFTEVAEDLSRQLIEGPIR